VCACRTLGTSLVSPFIFLLKRFVQVHPCVSLEGKAYSPPQNTSYLRYLCQFAVLSYFEMFDTEKFYLVRDPLLLPQET
jgi:hypothetical protein